MYKLQANLNFVKRLEDGATFPLNEKNPDCREYLEWLKKGNEPELADPVIEPPIEVSPWQIRKALNALGLRVAVEEMVSKTDDIVIKDGWQYATSFVENDPFVVGLGQALGKTPEELHELFVFAKGT
jgi:hypothetical protein